MHSEGHRGAIRIGSVFTVVALACATVSLPLVNSSAAAAQPSATPPPAAPPATPNWRTEDASTEADPGALVREALKEDKLSPTANLRVVSVVETATKPVIQTQTVHGAAAATQAVDTAQDNPRLLAVEIDDKDQHLLENDVAPLVSTNDPYANNLWGIDRLNAQTAWGAPGVARGAGVKVAVVDTGVAVVDDLTTVLPGYDATDAGGNGRNDGHGHGTHVSGTIAAAANNGIGVAGVAPNASIIPVKVLSDSGSGYTSDVAEGIVWAADHGADVINMSLGSSSSSSVMQTACAYAIGKGVVTIAAAGNSRTSNTSDTPASYPAAYPGVIGVAATQSNDSVASFSNRGSYVDIAAPGVGILSTLPNNGYASWSGTSMATPHVVGAAALVIAKARSIGSTASIPVLLTGTASDLGPAGWDPDFGFGMVNPVAAITRLSGPSTPPTAPTGVQVNAIGQSTATVNWTPGSGAAPAQYQATVTPGALSCVADGTANSCTISGLTPSTNYTVTVAARGLLGDSATSAPASFTTVARVDNASDNFGSPTVMPQGLVANDIIDSMDDRDFWKFTSTTVGQVRIALTNLPHDYDLYIYATNGSYIGGSWLGYTSDDVVTFNSLPAGEYVALVTPYSGYSTTSQYQLTVTVPSPPPPAEPTPPTDEPTPPADEPTPPAEEPTPAPEEPTPPPTQPTPPPAAPVVDLARTVIIGRTTSIPVWAGNTALSYVNSDASICRQVGTTNVVLGLNDGTCVMRGYATTSGGVPTNTLLRRVTITVVEPPPPPVLEGVRNIRVNRLATIPLRVGQTTLSYANSDPNVCRRVPGTNAVRGISAGRCVLSGYTTTAMGVRTDTLRVRILIRVRA